VRKYNYYDILKLINDEGTLSSPRGLIIKEVEYFQGEITNPWANYLGRNFNLDYVKQEFQWYLNAYPYDHRICKHAKMWEKIIQKDGRIFSNYGQYWFHDGIDKVVETLTDDPDSRQAIIPMLNKGHLFKGNKDVVCSVGPQFRIKNGTLNIHVKFRSSDAIFGLASDLPTYWFLWEMVALMLKMPTGRFIFSADSLHIYERHFKMVDSILENNYFLDITYPPITDTLDLLADKYDSPFGRWLKESPL
jgi:thymidylate synthase